MVKIIILISGIIIGGLLVIFILQNTMIVEVTLIGFTISMSRALMLLIVLGIGFVFGWVIKSLMGNKRNKKEEVIKKGDDKQAMVY